MTIETPIEIPLNDLYFNYIDTLSNKFHYITPDLEEGMSLPFELIKQGGKQKINPVIQAARPEHAREIVKIYKEIYHGTYPYKEMEDELEVKHMIEQNDHSFLIFKDNKGTIMGCFTFVFNFEEKRAYLRGYNVRPKYQKYFDVIKGFLGSLIGILYLYRNKILVWYAENRTAHAASQYFCQVAGVKNVAFLPNKDIFFRKIESDMLHVGYNKDALTTFRSREIPQIIPSIINCYAFSNKRYSLGKADIVNPKLILKDQVMWELKSKINVRIKKKKFNYQIIKFTLSNTDSYLKCLYTPMVKNIEKIEYNIDKLEELHVFLTELNKFCRLKNIRYAECLVSAHEPSHQQIFLKAGFQPRGYIPSWKYNSVEKKFTDHVMFNWFVPPLSKNIQLIEEGWELLKYLNL